MSNIFSRTLGNIIGTAAYYTHARGNLEKARPMYERAERLGMTAYNPRMAHGVLMLRTGRYDEAERQFENILKKNVPVKHLDNARLNFATACWKSGKIDTAITLVEDLEKTHRTARSNATLGFLYIAKGDLDTAIAYNTEALEYDDENHAVMDNLGQAYYRKGDLDTAQQWFEKNLEMDDKQPDSLYYMGLIKQRQGDYAAARNYFERTLDLRIGTLNTITADQVRASLAEVDALEGVQPALNTSDDED